MSTEALQSPSSSSSAAQTCFMWSQAISTSRIEEQSKEINAQPETAGTPPQQEGLSACQMEWSEEDLVFLHWRLLQEVNSLADPQTPLEEKFSTLRWIFTEREKDAKPFSFVSCLRVVGCSPLSPIAFCGLVDAEEIRDRIETCVPAWLRATLVRYPAWVQEEVCRNPDWIEEQLNGNPQWINEELKRATSQHDLFHG